MSNKRVITVALAALLLPAVAVPVSAQFLYGSLVGAVEDSSGAVIPDAKVQITNTGTGQSKEISTSADGSYSFTDLQPGTYSVAVSAKGFRTARAQEVTVTINTVSRLDVRLQVGEVTESVTISAEGALIQTDKAESTPT